MNYNSFFGFSESPFLDDLDQRFLFFSTQYELFLTALIEFVSQRQGIATLSGEEGVGKTMLIQTLLPKLPASFQPLIITRPAAEPLAITVSIAQELGLTLREGNLVNLTHLAEAVQAAARQGKYFFLILDDAHVLTDQHLEECYVLSQMAHQGRQLMPILLVGHKSLVQKLAGRRNQKLQKLILHQLALTGLPFLETTKYVDHRLHQVGSSFKACFSEGSSGQLFSRTGGIPRRINQFCDQALNRAWQENRPRVTRDLIGGMESTTPFKPLIPQPRYGPLARFGALAAAVLMSGLVVYVVYNNYYSIPLKTSPPVAEQTVSPSKTLPVPRQEPSPVPMTTVTQVQPGEHAAAGTAAPQETPPPEPQVVPEPEPTPVLPQAEASVVPQHEPPTVEAETTTPAMHQVSPEDGGLLKIVAGYYPDEQEIGYSAVILANPQIDNEDIIYPRQKLLLPKIDKVNNIITFNDKFYYYIYNHYNSQSQVEQVTTKLEEDGIPFVVRKTWLPDAGSIYRIFLGGYDSKAQLEDAIVLVNKD